MASTSVLTEDFENLLNSELDISRLKNKSLVITGATGLIGSLLVRFLLYANRKRKLNLTVYALVRNEAKAHNLYGSLLNDESLQLVVHDLKTAAAVNIEDGVDFIIHAAAVTASKVMVQDPVGTFEVALKGTKKMLELARQKKARMVYISSMEIYGQPKNTTNTTEEDLGFIDLTNPRSCYPEGKRACECLCTGYSAQYQVEVVSARLAQTFGAGVLPSENRVFAQFARSALKHEDLILHTQGLSEGNYVYTADAVKAILMLLYLGQPGQAYNVANEHSHLTIKAMAELVAQVLSEGQSQVVIDVPQDSASLGYAPDVKMKLNSKKLQCLGWKPTVALPEAYLKLAQWFEEIKA